MKILKNRKGAILVATYMVLFVIIVVAAGFFAMVVSNNKNITRENEGTKALNFAEMGIAYAYNEAYNSGWDWNTHEWNQEKTALSIAPIVLKVRDDCSFDGNGFYVHDGGEFMVKAYPDPDRDEATIVLAMGISGNERRVLKYYLSRRGIYDFYIYTPYNLDLNRMGGFQALNGGGIHANGNIYMDDYVRLENVSEISTGNDGSIYYTWSQYISPRRYDDGLGKTGERVRDSRAPITRLDNLENLFIDYSTLQPGPFGYYGTNNIWYWRDYATRIVGASKNDYPPRDFLKSEFHFSGDNQTGNNIAPGSSSNGAINDSTGPLNRYNAWIKPYKQDAEGEQIATTWTQIPAELDQQWSWDKYESTKDTTEQAVQFYTYDNNGNRINVENTRWYKNGNNVELLDEADFIANPNKYQNKDIKSYWQMYTSSEFWQGVRGDSNFVNQLDPEILDGSYGDERINNSDIIQVNHTNSKEQPNAWQQFLEESGLEGIVRDANTGGENLDPPDFEVTYARLAEKDGLYLNLDEDFDGEFDNTTEWNNELEKGIDNWADKLNDGDPENGVAKKVKFIDTFTGQWKIMLEIDLAKMQERNKYPANGIVYTQLPLRITNASKLARAKPKYGFTVLGEENIYLKGDYNTDEWVTSAIISKKRIYTLSEDFNDPQVVPATENYPDYPNMYVKGSGNQWDEVPPGTQGGFWVDRGYLGRLGQNDRYPDIPNGQQNALIARIDEKNSSYRSVFNVDDSSYPASQTYSWSWPATNETVTSGAMANKVRLSSKSALPAAEQVQKYNCLMASSRLLDGDHMNSGSVLENWHYHEGNNSITKNRVMKGSYFVLDNATDGGFSAANNEFVDYINNPGFYYSNRFRTVSGNNYYGSTFLHTYSNTASLKVSYDENFKTRTRAPSDVFFGGAEALWSEESVDYFYKLTGF